MGLRSYMQTIREKDPSIKSNIEVILYPTFWAVINHKIAHFFYRHKLFFISRMVAQISRFFTGIEIHPGAKIGKGLFIDHGAGVVIGETCEIGDNVLIYQGVTLGGTGKITGKRHPTIGNDVMIGAGVKVLGPFKVGDNSRIGAGSVVLREVPPNSTVVGIPAKVVKKDCEIKCCLDQIQFPDLIQGEMNRLCEKIELLEQRLTEMEEKVKV